MEGQHGGGADARTVQQPQGQALHEGEGGGFGCAVVDGAGDGRERQHGVQTHDVAVLQLQHPRQEGLGGLRVDGEISVRQPQLPAPLDFPSRGEQTTLDTGSPQPLGFPVTGR